MVSIRWLRVGDEQDVATLTRDEADFGLTDVGPARPALSREAISRYLGDESVVHWVAEADGQIVGHLHCQLIRRHVGREREILLYDIGVRSAWRRRGVGRSLMQTMFAWMDANSIGEVWVLSDAPGAEDFYRACGFYRSEAQPIYMTHQR